jgi:hypothetical protein
MAAIAESTTSFGHWDRRASGWDWDRLRAGPVGSPVVLDVGLPLQGAGARDEMRWLRRCDSRTSSEPIGAILAAKASTLARRSSRSRVSASATASSRSADTSGRRFDRLG